MNNKTLRIVIADDHEIFRKGLRTLLQTLDNTEVCAEVANGKELLDILQNDKCDIIFMDIKMPVMNGIEATKIITKKYPEIKIIVLTGYYEEEDISNIYKTKVNGIISKNDLTTQIKTAIQSVMEGGIYFSEEIYEIIEKAKRINENIKKITKKELNILNHIIQGDNNFTIALKLFISPKTVEFHRSNLLKKTESNNLAQLTAFAIKKNLIKI